MSLAGRHFLCSTVTQDETSDGDIEIGEGCSFDSDSWMCDTQDGQWRFDSRNECDSAESFKAFERPLTSELFRTVWEIGRSGELGVVIIVDMSSRWL